MTIRSNRVFLLAILFPAFLMSCHSEKKKDGGGGGAGRQQGPLVVDGFVVSPHAVSDNIEVPGSLLPAEETQIRTEVAGRIVQMNIVEGTTVERGALLVKLFDQDLQAQLN